MLPKTARKLVIGVVGGMVLATGVVMIVAPGPAFLVIPAGLAILGTEFLWARRLLRKIKQQAQAAIRPSTPRQEKGRPARDSPESR